MESDHQVPIWFFIGSLLLLYGIIITAAGIYALAYPPPLDQRVALFDLHADIWWGLLLVVLGGFYCIRFRPNRNLEQ